MGAPAPVLVIGEALIDVVREGREISRHPGGSPMNVSTGLGALGHTVTLATRLGDDADGTALLDYLKQHQVALSPGSVTSGSATATATATLDDEGAADYEFDIDWALPTPLSVPPGTHVHTGSIAATLEPGGAEVLRTIREARPTSTISYDPNVRPHLMRSAHAVRPRVEELVGLSDVVKVSDEDLAWLYDGGSIPHLIRLWCHLGPRMIVVTLGKEGALVALTRYKSMVRVSPGTTRVVDTVGAGDSFMAGLTSGLVDAGLLGGVDARERLNHATQADLADAVARATACAAWTVGQAGASSPTRDNLATI